MTALDFDSIMLVMQPVFRIEAYGEAPVPFTSLAVAMQIGPRHAESYIATSPDGIHLADAEPNGGPGGVLMWCLTLPGQDVIDRAGWTVGVPVLSAAEYDAVLELALREELDVAS